MAQNDHKKTGMMISWI